ncbi:2-isopropylmalate synthase [archaeon]|nr:2-isopropylmalate synthase [archaeon]
MKVELYDTTLRDGAQSEYISFTVKDKLIIAKKLDELGIHYVEGGFPSSNPKDAEFFSKVKEIEFENSRIVAFGSTRHAKVKAEDDMNLRSLVDSGTDYVTIFGKSWDMHVRDALKISPEENLSMITDSIEYLREHGIKVFFDAEHFFDGYMNNKEYAMKTLRAAEEAKASCLVLCDTNGSALPFNILEILNEVKGKIKTALGIHAHNDSDSSVANSVIAVRAGTTQVHGTINGYGERCGNANLCSVIPNIKLKLHIDCINDNQLKKLTEVSKLVAELANLSHLHNMPYVGRSAFAHKGGVHIDAVLKNPSTYEHIKPELVGNERRFLISDLSGKSNILAKAKELGLKLEKGSPEVRIILNQLKEMEKQGYQFEGAEASFELLLMRTLGMIKKFFVLDGFRITVDTHDEELTSEGTVKVRVGNRYEHTAAEGNGPVNALDNALRKALEKFYPSLRDVYLTDYKVRVLDTTEGTGAKVRVLIESTDGKDIWSTVGVSENIIEASLKALIDSIEYKLHRTRGQSPPIKMGGLPREKQG